MLQLFYSDASPYARKVRIVAMEKQIDLALLPVVASDDPPQLHAANAIGKVPTLLLEDGTGLGESGHICQYLENLQPSPALFGSDIGILRRDALAIGLMDALVRHVLEVRRPEEWRWQPWIERQHRAITRTLAVLEAETFGSAFTIDHVTTATALGYLDLRIPDFGWRQNHPKLAALNAEWLKRPSVRDSVPAS